MQQQWLRKRLDTFLPVFLLMRAHGIHFSGSCRCANTTRIRSSRRSYRPDDLRRATSHDLPVLRSVRGIAKRMPQPVGERLAMGGTSQGGVYTAIRSTKAPSGPAGGQVQAQAELWGDEQWQVLKAEIEKRNPEVDRGRHRRRCLRSPMAYRPASSKECPKALGPKWTSKFKHADGLPLDLIATRLPEENAWYADLQPWSGGIIDTACLEMSSLRRARRGPMMSLVDAAKGERPRTRYVVPADGRSAAQRAATDAQLGDNPIIQKGDVLHCDFGITALRLNTDTQHMGYVLRDGETAPRPGLKLALANSNKLQDIAMAEIRPGRTGNEILKSSRSPKRKRWGSTERSTRIRSG